MNEYTLFHKLFNYTESFYHYFSLETTSTFSPDVTPISYTN